MFYLYEILMFYLCEKNYIERALQLASRGHFITYGVKYQRNAIIISPERSRKSKVSDFRQPFLGSAKVSCVI